ncbi:hypothetical protein Taro_043756 [Colocasia esculenta]|uniref:4-coumarate--CoA ligase n=1 Tax=Colocasia esculenta TaxID=4460 RepID=A0A843WWK5_COLES|nr:hypothetical protein [Colocasia esculenta]
MGGGGAAVDPRSGFCKSNSIFYSKRRPILLPSDPHLSVTTFMSSRPHSGHVALVDAPTGRRVTYPELWRAVRAVAASLSARHGVRKGQVVLILSPNSIDFPIVALAVMSLGGVLTTTNPLNTPGEIAKQVADAKPRLAFTTPALISKLSEGAAASLPVVVLDSDDKVPDDPRVVSCITEMVKSNATGVSAAGNVEEKVSQDDTATLLYSSGTTGTSKGVASTHRNLISMVQIVRSRYRREGPSLVMGSHVFVCTVPMFHVYGLAFFAMGLLGAGSTVVVLPKFEMGEMMSAVSRYRANYLPLVPPILVQMVKGAESINAEYDLSSLRTVLCGGAPLTGEVIEEFIKRFPGVEILQGYGLTETTGIGASADSVEESRRHGTAGLLVPNTQARIVDPETGESLPVKRTGELWLRGPYVMKGYFSNPRASATTLVSDGWLRTGDICYIDEDGFVFVVDRLKELIKYKGYQVMLPFLLLVEPAGRCSYPLLKLDPRTVTLPFLRGQLILRIFMVRTLPRCAVQVAPAELEALLLTHPQVSDAAVIPFPDKAVGQLPMAYVVRKEGSHLQEKGVIDFVARQVAPYKKIRRVAFVLAIPKTASGKILRKDLVKLATSKL